MADRNEDSYFDHSDDAPEKLNDLHEQEEAEREMAGEYSIFGTVELRPDHEPEELEELEDEDETTEEDAELLSEGELEEDPDLEPADDDWADDDWDEEGDDVEEEEDDEFSDWPEDSPTSFRTTREWDEESRYDNPPVSHYRSRLGWD